MKQPQIPTSTTTIQSKLDSKIAVCLGIEITLAFWANCVFAQITPDATLPNNSTVKLEGNSHVIEGGTRASGNLFHSFSEFSVSNGDTAFFNNALDIQNIISRVTGKSVSNIDGLIKANGTANLFLLNPNGIIFGENALLNVGGSFVATTANAIQFGNQGFFSATNPNTPLLLTVNPSAFLFNQIAAPIQNNSVSPTGLAPTGFNAYGLRVPDGSSLLILGGNISMDKGQLNAFGGRVELGGLAGAGTVGLNGNGSNLSLSFPENVVRADVSLNNAARVNVMAESQGSIAINARNIDILGTSWLHSGIGMGLGTPESQAGDLTLNATGTIQADQAARILNIVDSNAIGNTGNINLTANSLSLTNGAQLSVSIFGRGNAGNANIQVRDRIFFDGLDSNGFSSGVFSAVEQGASGKGGNINISTGSLVLNNGARLDTSTYGQGDTGSITVKATDTISLDGVGSNGTTSGIFNNVSPNAVGEGKDSQISVTTGSLSLTNGAQIISSTFGQGNAGDITINADTFSLDGVTSNGSFPSGVFSSVESRNAVGNGGQISVTTGSLSLTNGARVSASTRGRGNGGDIFIDARNNIFLDGVGGNNFFSGVLNEVVRGAIGDGGNISVTTGSLLASNGAKLTASTSGLGNAANVTVNARDTISLDGRDTGIFNNVRNRGNGGNVTVITGTLSVTNNAQLSTSTFFKGNAGNLSIDARDRISFDGSNTGAFSRVGARAEGKGGNISLTTGGSLSVTNGAELSSATVGIGDAGDVTIKAQDSVYIDGANSNIASAVARTLDGQFIGQGNGGNVTITTGSLSVTNGGRIIASTYGKGDAGNVKIDAREKVSFDRVGSDGRSSEAIVAVLKGAEGNAGAITINTGSLDVTNGARLVSVAEGQGNAGNVTINARDAVYFGGIGSNQRSSSIFSNLASGIAGKGGDITINTGSMSATDGAILTVSTAGQGDAGNVRIEARNTVAFSKDASLSASTSGQGNAGSVTIKAGESFSLTNNANVAAVVYPGARGNAGDITVIADSLSLTDGAGLTSTTGGQGDAGSVNIIASDRVSLSGSNTGLFSRVLPTAVGEGGNIAINTNSLSVNNEAQITASNIGQGTAGDIEVTARSIQLNNKGSIQAITTSGNGGDMTFNVQNALILLRTSQISTTAGTDQKDGNGGNITINAPSGFIVAVPHENSDITANAFKGAGGKIQINATGIFGIQPRSNLTNLSDITASSTTGVNGDIIINRYNVDPTQGLTELPVATVNTNNLVDSGCTTFDDKTGSRFTITGNGGLPPSPNEFLTSESVWSDTRLTAATKPQNGSLISAAKPQKTTQPVPIIPATGWLFNNQGEVKLVNQDSSSDAYSIAAHQPACLTP